MVEFSFRVVKRQRRLSAAFLEHIVRDAHELPDLEGTRLKGKLKKMRAMSIMQCIQLAVCPVARISSEGAESFSIRRTGIPFCVRARARVSPVGPAPALSKNLSNYFGEDFKELKIRRTYYQNCWLYRHIATRNEAALFLRRYCDRRQLRE